MSSLGKNRNKAAVEKEHAKARSLPVIAVFLKETEEKKKRRENSQRGLQRP